MSGRHNLRLTLTLAVASGAGIVGMLVLHGPADFLALLVAVLPLLVGGLRLWRASRCGASAE